MPETTDQVMTAIDRMLNPASIAVVGATQRLQYGGRFLQAVLRNPDVRVYPVNPRYEELMGVRCYPSLRELPESPDLVGVIVQYDRVMEVLEQSAEVKAGSAIVISAGFAERGTDEGGALQQRIGEFARESGVRVCGPNCLGVANVRDGIWACASSQSMAGASGPIALVSQSGASAFGPFLSQAVDKGIGYSYIVSTGNEADLDSCDFIRYLLDDDGTRAVACFIEGFKDGRKLMEVARLALQRGKPLVMIKVGKSELGSRAARSHTAALTGSDAVHDAAFRQLGVTRVDGYEELLEVSQLLALSPAPEVEGISVVSHSGGISSMTADKCGELGLRLPELRAETREALNGILKGFGWAANPADVTGLANSESFPSIMEHMFNEPEVGTMVVCSGMGDSQAQQVIELRQRSYKAMAFLWTGSRSSTAGLPLLKEANIPLFHEPASLARGLSALLEYHRRRVAYTTEVSTPAGPTPAPIKKERQALLSSFSGPNLSEHDAKELLAAWGIVTTRERRATTSDDAVSEAYALGYPVALKVESSNILHKSDGGLVHLNLRDETELRAAYDEIMSTTGRLHPNAEIKGVLVQEMVTGGVEVIVGVSRDLHFGPVILFGMGGTLVELYRDVAMRVCPISRVDALEMIQEVKGARLLEGHRGSPEADMDALVDAMLRVSKLAVELGDTLEELDINPLAVLPKGQGAKALDALAVIAR